MLKIAQPKIVHSVSQGMFLVVLRKRTNHICFQASKHLKSLFNDRRKGLIMNILLHFAMFIKLNLVFAFNTM